ncbi:MAG: hypothetical protein JXA46_18610 [Dehalococcoidales bacterium]|nr:hypothetical protein [Dehalococcoidales bacterium]
MKSPAKILKNFTSILFVLAVLVGTMVPAIPVAADGPYTITATGDSNGAAVASPSNPQEGGTSVITFTPTTDGYGLMSVTDNEADVTSEVEFNAEGGGKYTLENITENHTIQAAFSELYVTVNAGSFSYKVSHLQFFSMPTWNVTYAPSGYLFNGVPVSDLVDLITEASPINYNIRAVSDYDGTKSFLGPAIEPVISIDDEIQSRETIIAKTRRCEGDSSKNRDYNTQGTLASTIFDSTSLFNREIGNIDVVYTIACSFTGQGTITPADPLDELDGMAVVDYGSSPTFNIDPAQGYFVQDVIVDESSKGPLRGWSFDTVTANHTLSVVFEPLTKYNITVTAGEHGRIEPPGIDGVVQVSEGCDQTFNIIPNEGYHISNLLVDGNQVVPLVATYNFTDVVSDRTIEATFAEGTQDWPLQLIGVSTWNITQEEFEGLIAGIGAPAVPSNEYTDGDGNKFKGLSLYRLIGLVDDADSGTFNPGAMPYYDIILSAADGWSKEIIPADYSGDFPFADNDDIFIANKVMLNGEDTWIDLPLTKPVSEGKLWYPLACVGDGIGSGKMRVYALTKIELDFEDIPITASAGANGSIDPVGEVIVDYGTDKTFTITPDDGYHIDDVLVDGNSVGAVGEYIFPCVVESHTIEASFMENDITVWVDPAMQEVASGTTFSVDIKIDTNAETAGWQLDVCFNPEMLQVDGVAEGGFLADWAGANGYETVPGAGLYIDNETGIVSDFSYAIVGNTGPGGASGEGVLCSITFTASRLADELTGITIGDVRLYDAYGNALTGAGLVHGNVQITLPENDRVVELKKGWNTFSVPAALDPKNAENKIGNLLPQVPDAPTVFAYDNAAKEWIPLDANYILKPLEAVYVCMLEDYKVLLHLDPGKTAPPAMNVYAGWNLVSLASMEAMKASEALISVEKVTGDLTGYVQVISPNMENQNYWAYIVGQEISDLYYKGWMGPYLAYWVFMINDGLLGGFTTTPLGD